MARADWTEEKNRVGERFSFLANKKVHVKLSILGPTEVVYEYFDGIFIDALPAGRETFFRFDFNGKERLERTISVVEMMEA